MKKKLYASEKKIISLNEKNVLSSVKWENGFSNLFLLI